MSKLQIIVFGRPEKFKPAELFSVPTVFFASSDRMGALSGSQSDWVWMLDEDCVPVVSPNQIYQQIAELDQNVIYGGIYQNPTSSSWLTQAYNFLCNFWVLESKSENLLGGSLLISSKARIALVDQQPPFLWGGEDTYLIRQLQKGGFSCRSVSWLNVTHSPQQSLKKVVLRAWAHGCHAAVYGLESTKMQKQRIFKSPHFWKFSPFFAIHFLFFGLGYFWHKDSA